MKNATKCLYSKNTAFKAFRWNISSRNNFKFLKSGQLLLAAKAKPIIHGKWSFLVQFFIKCWEGSQRGSSNSKEDNARSYRKILDNYERIWVKLSIKIVQKIFVKIFEVHILLQFKKKNPRNFALMLKSVVHKQIVHKSNVISFTFSRVFFKYAEQVLV